VLPHAGKFVSAGKVLRREAHLFLSFQVAEWGYGTTSTWKIPACRAESIQPLIGAIKKTEQQIPFDVQAFLRQSIRPGPDAALDYCG